MNKQCPVCNGTEFTYTEVLWPELIHDWELLPNEVEYINQQLGFCCNECGNNLRSMALASAVLSKYHFEGALSQFLGSDMAGSLKVLEINEAGGLSSIFLGQLPNHVLIKYPDFDMTRLPFEDSSFNLVLHYGSRCRAV